MNKKRELNREVQTWLAFPLLESLLSVPSELSLNVLIYGNMQQPRCQSLEDHTKVRIQAGVCRPTWLPPSSSCHVLCQYACFLWTMRAFFSRIPVSGCLCTLSSFATMGSFLIPLRPPSLCFPLRALQAVFFVDTFNKTSQLCCDSLL